jgi:putative transcriptional regulator
MSKPQQKPSLAERIKLGLQEAIQHERGEITLRTHHVIKAAPPPNYQAEEIAAIRNRLGFSQGVFALKLAVSVKTVRSWEQGTRVPSGAAARLLQLMENPKALETLVKP